MKKLLLPTTLLATTIILLFTGVSWQSIPNHLAVKLSKAPSFIQWNSIVDEWEKQNSRNYYHNPKMDARKLKNVMKNPQMNLADKQDSLAKIGLQQTGTQDEMKQLMVLSVKMKEEVPEVKLISKQEWQRVFSDAYKLYRKDKSIN